MMKSLILAACAVALTFPGAAAAEGVKLGFLAPMSGPLGSSGEEMRRGFDLALDELGNRLGGVPVTVVSFDDKAVPAVAVQGASKLVDEDKVDIVTGMTASNVFLAAAPTFIAGNAVVVGAMAGPEEFAGKQCNADVFVSSFQNDEWDEALGTYLNSHGYKRVYFIGLDFQACWNLWRR